MIVVKDIIKPCVDWQRHTCIQVDRLPNEVKYIALDIDTGLEVRSLSPEVFDQKFKPLDDYPPARACTLYTAYARVIGATPDALKYLGAFNHINNEDFNMATTKKPTAATKAAEKPVKAAKASKAAVKAEASVKPAKAASKASKAALKAKDADAKPRAQKETASSMFRDLIMRGTMTNNAIWLKVSEKYNLDDSKRYYVSWYRNSLKKAGMDVPPVKK